jgi:ribulose-bisphosphate carboxylase large chain
MMTDTRFTVVYQLVAPGRDSAVEFAQKIGTEQSVEFPLDILPESARKALPEIVSVEQAEEPLWAVKISYPASITGDDPTQFLNVLFGNISLLDGIKITNVSDDIFSEMLKGPSFGITGIRKTLGVVRRALSSTALKPVGLSAADLAQRAFLFAKGGIDIVKDDHGLADQSMAPFQERVSLCAMAIRRGEQESGKRTLYFPNITTSPQHLLERFELAITLGADGVLICPQLAGLESLHSIASLKEVPVMAHPAFSGAYIRTDHGFAPDFYYGKLWRAFGADAVIYPNTGGRFSFSQIECHSINDMLRTDFCGYKTVFPVPGGGVNLRSLPKWLEEYGNDTLFLIGGNLYKQSDGLEVAAREFQQILINYG